MKNLIIGTLQAILGYKNYLILFSCLKIISLRLAPGKKDYLRFVKMISQQNNVLVIGANTGITTVPVARRLTSGKIFAFEPVAQNIDVLRSILKLFNVAHKVIVFHLALGNATGKIKMILPVWRFTKKHGFAHVYDDVTDKGEKGILSGCPLKKLDDVEELKTIKIDFIKIVAENYEFNIFSGGKNLIRKNKPVIYCELWENNHRSQVLELIETFGYQIKVFRNGELQLYDPSIDREKYFFFIPEG